MQVTNRETRAAMSGKKIVTSWTPAHFGACHVASYLAKLRHYLRIQGVNVIPISNPSGDRKRVTVWPHGSFLSLTSMR